MDVWQKLYLGVLSVDLLDNDLEQLGRQEVESSVRLEEVGRVCKWSRGGHGPCQSEAKGARKCRSKVATPAMRCEG